MIPGTTQKTSLLEQTVERFWETFPPMWGAIRSHLRLVVAENSDIAIEQFHILRYVRKGTGSVSELAAIQHLSRPAISQAVDLLVKKGLLTRHQHPEDRRYVHLELTADGDALVDAVFAHNRQWMGERLAVLSTDEMATILQAMDSFKKAFGIPTG